MQRMKRAASGEANAADDTIHTRAYRQPPHMSSASANFFSQADHRTKIALGHLLIYLTSRPLPDAERRIGWHLVQKWLSEYVQMKRTGPAEVA